MADDEEKARQEKIAAARKRVEQMKKKKGKKSAATKKDEDESPQAAPTPSLEDRAQAGASESGATEDKTEPAEHIVSDNEKAVEEDRTGDGDASPSGTPSLAQQSKLRSTSFRTGTASPASPGPFSPDGETALDIYKKQVSRIEELERENRKLLKESSDAEKRWQKAEDELAVLREEDGDASSKTLADGEVDKL
ncbi:hypothetical protein E4U43_002550, partial [Claviceps pusilla]